MISLRGISPAATFGLLQKSLSDTDWNFKQIVLKFTDPMKFTPPIILDRPVVDFSRSIILQTAGKTRWQTGLNGSLESGANAGGDYILQAVADDGITPLGQVFFGRADGSLTAPGRITSTNGGHYVTSGSSVVVANEPASTSFKVIQWENAGTRANLGTEDSVGGQLFGGSSAYAVVLGAQGARNLEFFTNNAKRLTIDSAGTLIVEGSIVVKNFVVGGSGANGDLNLQPATAAGVTVFRSHTGALVGFVTTAGALVMNSTGTFANTVTANNSGAQSLIIINTTTGAVSETSYLALQRGGATKWRVGVNVTSTNVDDFNIWSEGVGAAMEIIKSTNAVIFLGGSLKLGSILALGNVPNLLRIQRVNSTTFNMVTDANGFADLELQSIIAHGSLSLTGNVGFYGTAAAAKPTVTGSRGGNAAVASLLTGLAGLGLITDSSSP